MFCTQIQKYAVLQNIYFPQKMEKKIESQALFVSFVASLIFFTRQILFDTVRQRIHIVQSKLYH